MLLSNKYSHDKFNTEHDKDYEVIFIKKIVLNFILSDFVWPLRCEIYRYHSIIETLLVETIIFLLNKHCVLHFSFYFISQTP